MSSNVELKVSDNSWVRRIEEAVSKNHFKRYEYKDFSNIQEIGSGSFGKVYRGNWKNTHKHVVLKSFVGLNNVMVKEILYEVICRKYNADFPISFGLHYDIH